MDKNSDINRCSSIFVKISTDEYGISKGYFASFYLKAEIPFEGLGDMVLKIDRLLEKLQKAEKDGTPVKPVRSFESFTFPGKMKYLFVLDIKYLQHCSWQGVMKCTGCSGLICFKSTLELMRKMTDVMQIPNEPLYSEDI